MQGDIVKIIDENKTVVATYEYDDWGKLLTSDADLTDIAELNPFRYRGYYYDTESGLYYLNSRYYDPETGRFINADAYVSTGFGIAGYNMFAYCIDNPIIYEDESGHSIDTAIDIANLVGDAVDLAANPGNPFSWFALAADVVSLILPGLTGGGKIIRFIAKSDDLADASKYADDVMDVSQSIKSSLKTGKELHDTYSLGLGDADVILNSSIKKITNGVSDSLLRPDGVDLNNNIIYELKPYNKISFNKALKQTQQYLSELSKNGGSWIIVIDMYCP